MKLQRFLNFFQKLYNDYEERKLFMSLEWIAAHKCSNCEKLHDEPSAFCSHKCFNEWYDKKELPSLIVSMAIKAIQNANTRHS
jgi:hypothetical protein